MRTALSLGSNNWNGGELYGSPERNSLHLLNEYFTKYPGDADKVVLSIKGGLVPGQFKPDGSKAGIQRSIDECLKQLDGKKSLDLFECVSGVSFLHCKEDIALTWTYSFRPVLILQSQLRRQSATLQSM